MAANRRFPTPKPIEWLYLVGGLFLVARYFWLFDDAFVYFRYIDNLLFLRIGLVFNAGEYVEGFTSPLWLILLGLVRVLRIGYTPAIWALAVLCFMVFWYTLVVVNRRLSPPSTVVNLPLAYLAFNYGVASYFSSGVETPLIQMTAVVYALFILKPSLRAPQIVLAASPLLRHEFILPLVICIAWAWYASKKRPTRLIVMSGLFLGAWLLFRVTYYADLLPNTFYLKDDVLLRQGFVYLHHTLATYACYLLVIVSLLAFVALKKRGVSLDGQARLVMIAAALPVTLYVIKIGGAPIHYRFLAFPFCLVACSVAGLAEHLCRAYVPQRVIRLAPLAGVAVACLSLFLYPPQYDKHPLYSDVTTTVVSKINTPLWHEQKIGREFPNWNRLATIQAQRDYRSHQRKLRYRDTISEDLCVSVYQKFDHEVVHSFGLTDPILARVDTEPIRPGHKRELIGLARQLVVLRKKYGNTDRGMHRRMVERGEAPDWVANNLDTIEILEKKMFNTHRFTENIRLAFMFPERIKL